METASRGAYTPPPSPDSRHPSPSDASRRSGEHSPCPLGRRIPATKLHETGVEIHFGGRLFTTKEDAMSVVDGKPKELPAPRVHLTKYHWILAPAAARSLIIPRANDNSSETSLNLPQPSTAPAVDAEPGPQTLPAARRRN